MMPQDQGANAGGDGLISVLADTARGYFSAKDAAAQAEKLRREAQAIKADDRSYDLTLLKTKIGGLDISTRNLAIGMVGLGMVLMVFKMVGGKR